MVFLKLFIHALSSNSSYHFLCFECFTFLILHTHHSKHTNVHTFTAIRNNWLYNAYTTSSKVDSIYGRPHGHQTSIPEIVVLAPPSKDLPEHGVTIFGTQLND
jgi:hypothetical protein